jgi:hypothetical protein
MAHPAGPHYEGREDPAPNRRWHDLWAERPRRSAYEVTLPDGSTEKLDHLWQVLKVLRDHDLSIGEVTAMHREWVQFGHASSGGVRVKRT